MNNIFTIVPTPPAPPGELPPLTKEMFHPKVTSNLYPGYENPHEVADRLVTDHYTHKDGTPLLTLQDDEWHLYSGTKWEHITDNYLRGDVTKHLRTKQIAQIALDDEGNEKPGKPIPWVPKSARKREVVEAMRDNFYSTPQLGDTHAVWVGAPVNGWEAEDCRVMANGILHMPTRTLIEHTPKLFTLHHINFEYDETATAPTWGKVMEWMYEHDPKGLDFWQEFGGACITRNTSHQKGALIVGPGGGGKGISGNALARCVGEEAVTHTDFTQLGSRFGKVNLIGKDLGIIPDAADADKRAAGEAVRVWKSAIAGDEQIIEAKGVNVKESRRLTVNMLTFSNKVPGFMSGDEAAANRVIGVQLIKGTRGNNSIINPLGGNGPIPDLGNRIDAEVAGVFNWFLDGADRLKRNGTYTLPDTHEAVVARLDDSNAELRDFLTDTFTHDPEGMIWIKALRDEFVEWRARQRGDSWATAGDEAVYESTLREDLGQLADWPLEIKYAKPTAQDVAKYRLPKSRAWQVSGLRRA